MAAKRARSKPEAAALERLLDETLTDACGEDEQLWALRQAFEDNVRLPADASVVGEAVSVVEIDYDGNARRGLTARCHSADGSEHVVAACDVAFPAKVAASRYVAVYRLWLGLEPLPPAHHIDPRVETRGNRAVAKSTLDPLAELVVLSVKKFAARCRFLGSDHVVSLRTSRVRDLVPGEIITLRPSQQWPDARHARVSGDVEGRRIDVAALELASAALDECGVWDPEEEYWGEEGEPIEEWAREIIARGQRPLFELEQVLPGEDPDARHYEVGVRVGELSLGKDFDGVLACAACTGMACASGDWGASTRRSVFSNACSGSTRTTTRESVFSFRWSEKARPGNPDASGAGFPDAGAAPIHYDVGGG
jgi:hypothetical protein